MYTATMAGLGIIGLLWLYIYSTENKINWMYFFTSCTFFTLLGWMEFAHLNIKDSIAGWIFNPAHVTGVMVGIIPLEDFLFAPIMAYLFFLMYVSSIKHCGEASRSREGYKTITFAGMFLLTFFFFVFGEYLSKYSAIRMLVGMLGILYAWDNWNLKHFYLFMGGCTVGSMAWDLWANFTEQWLYRVDPDLSSFQAAMYIKYGKEYSNAFMSYSWNWIPFGKMWMPLEIMPYYYINGGVCIYGVLSALRRKFPKPAGENND